MAALSREAGGTALLALVLVLCGIIAERTAHGTLAPALLIVAGAYGATLGVLASLWPAARLSPIASLIAALRGTVTPARAALEVGAQVAGAVAGVLAAHALANMILVQMATLVRASPGVWLGEGLAALAFAYVLARATPARLGLAAFAIALASAGTAFPNPALTIARTLTDSFVAVRFADALGLVALEVAAALIVGSRGGPAPARPA